MGRSAIVAAVVLFLATGTLPAEGATIIVATDCGLGNVSRGTTTDVATGIARSSACILTDPLATGSDLAMARGSFDTVLTLGVLADMDTTVRNFADFVTASAMFTDVVTPTGGTPGTAGTALFSFPVSGSTTVTVSPGAANCDSGANCYEAALAIGSQKQLIDGPSLMQFALPVVFGASTNLVIRLSADVAISAGAAPKSADVVLDYFSTVTLTSVTLLDASGAVLPDARLVSATPGLVYPTGATAVPEPSSIWLLAAGAAGIYARRRAPGASARSSTR